MIYITFCRKKRKILRNSSFKLTPLHVPLCGWVVNKWYLPICIGKKLVFICLVFTELNQNTKQQKTIRIGGKKSSSFEYCIAKYCSLSIKSRHLNIFNQKRVHFWCGTSCALKLVFLYTSLSQVTFRSRNTAGRYVS